MKFEDTAANNGEDTITGFTAGDTTGGDVLDFSAFITSGLAGEGINGTSSKFEYLTPDSTNGNGIANKVFLLKADTSSDTSAIANLIESTASANKLGLAKDAKAVALVSNTENLGSSETFSIYYITGGESSETIELVGTVAVSAGDGLIAANFGIS